MQNHAFCTSRAWRAGSNAVQARMACGLERREGPNGARVELALPCAFGYAQATRIDKQPCFVRAGPHGLSTVSAGSHEIRLFVKRCGRRHAEERKSILGTSWGTPCRPRAFRRPLGGVSRRPRDAPGAPGGSQRARRDNRKSARESLIARRGDQN